MFSLFGFLALAGLLSSMTSARQITVINSCQSTIWPGMHTGVGGQPGQATGWELPSKQETIFEVPDTWQAGRIWARTGCTLDGGNFKCLTGGCGPGSGGDLKCQGTNEPPATLAEFTLNAGGMDHYDISLVDGFNVPMTIHASIDSCESPACAANINPLCPGVLRSGIDAEGKNLGCLAACNAGFGQEKFGNRACCSGGYNDPALCAICGVDYYSLFKDNCKSAYAVCSEAELTEEIIDCQYAYDEKSKTALWTCPSTSQKADYTIEFCPNRTDYVGTQTPGKQYEGATATCSNKATAFSQTFKVGPSPTKGVQSGTLDVVATVATGLDGAAALETSQGGTTITVTSASTSSTSDANVASVSSTRSHRGRPKPSSTGGLGTSHELIDDSAVQGPTSSGQSAVATGVGNDTGDAGWGQAHGKGSTCNRKHRWGANRHGQGRGHSGQ